MSLSAQLWRREMWAKPVQRVLPERRNVYRITHRYSTTKTHHMGFKCLLTCLILHYTVVQHISESWETLLTWLSDLSTFMFLVMLAKDDVEVQKDYCYYINNKTKITCLIMFSGAPTCRCLAGFTGPNCNQRTCENYCKNGGNCTVNRGNQPTCSCPADFLGDQCQYRKYYRKKFHFSHIHWTSA